MQNIVTAKEFYDASVQIGERSFRRGVLTAGLLAYSVPLELTGHAPVLAAVCAAGSAVFLLAGLRDRRRLGSFRLDTQNDSGNWFAEWARTTNNLLWTAGLLTGACTAQTVLSWKSYALALVGVAVTELSGQRAKRIYEMMKFYSATR